MAKRSGSGPAVPSAGLLANGGVAAPSPFRYDINGLRAVAVLSVLLFHFKVPGFGGGFVGVDIFFVISGLLMTQIIDRGIRGGEFSLIGFYAARFRRIVPALAALCAVVLATVLILTDPMTAGKPAQGVLAAITFTSNHVFAFQQGYFAGASEENWMLHSWTLSVEWQFYLLYPVLLLLLSRSAILWAWRQAILLLGFGISFALALLLVQLGERLEQQAFFILPTRAWEMIAGGIVALTPAPRRVGLRKAMALAGAAAIVWSILGFSNTLSWPGLHTLVPVIGTAAILAARDGDARWARFPGVQALGTWSYSIYLWHWPIAVGLVYFQVPYRASVIAAALVASILFGWASYVLVETRLRNALFERAHPKTGWRFAVASVALLAATASAGWRSDGLEAARTARQAPATRVRLADYRAATRDWVGIRHCHNRKLVGESQRCDVGERGEKVLMLGDSYVEQSYPRIERMAQRGEIRATLLFQPGCPPLPNLAWPARHGRCAAFFDAATRIAADEDFDRIVVFAAWGAYFGGDNPNPRRPCRLSLSDCQPMSEDAAREALAGGFDRLGDWLAMQTARGREVVIILPPLANARLDPPRLYRASFEAGRPVVQAPISRAQLERQLSGVREMLAKQARRSGARLVDPLDWQCGDGACQLYDKGRFLFRDRHHIRASLIGGDRFAFIDAALR